MYVLFVFFDRSESSHYNIVGQGSLQISDITADDQGSYTCRATNQEDSKDVDAALSVQGMNREAGKEEERGEERGNGLNRKTCSSLNAYRNRIQTNFFKIFIVRFYFDGTIVY